MLRENASQQMLDRIEMMLEPPLPVRAERLREEWDDGEAFASFQGESGFTS